MWFPLICKFKNYLDLNVHPNDFGYKQYEDIQKSMAWSPENDSDYQKGLITTDNQRINLVMKTSTVSKDNDPLAQSYNQVPQQDRRSMNRIAPM